MTNGELIDAYKLKYGRQEVCVGFDSESDFDRAAKIFFGEYLPFDFWSGLELIVPQYVKEYLEKEHRFNLRILRPGEDSYSKWFSSLSLNDKYAVHTGNYIAPEIREKYPLR